MLLLLLLGILSRAILRFCFSEPGSSASGTRAALKCQGRLPGELLLSLLTLPRLLVFHFDPFPSFTYDMLQIPHLFIILALLIVAAVVVVVSVAIVRILVFIFSAFGAGIARLAFLCRCAAFAVLAAVAASTRITSALPPKHSCYRRADSSSSSWRSQTPPRPSVE